MALTHAIKNFTIYFPPPEASIWKSQSISPSIPSSNAVAPKFCSSSILKTGEKDDVLERARTAATAVAALPTMADIIEASTRQNLDLQLQSLGPFFRITAKSLKTGNELGRLEGLVRLWSGGKILHLDSIKLRRETVGMEKSIFGIGLYIGAAAIRYGYDCGCKKAELLAINDTDAYHSKVPAAVFLCSIVLQSELDVD